MPKTRNKFDYNKNRKKLKKKLLKKRKPRIENAQIRNAWDDSKSTSRNLLDMGLSFDPNRTMPVKKKTLPGHRKEPKHITTKPYVLKKLQEEASLPEKDCKTLSSDLIQYVQHMVREHKDDYKAMARDEKNYYQDTPKQIRRKINEYQRCHPQHYQAFMSSLSAPEPMAQ
ncbi:nucleolar protein 16 [Austrofundulus limnaeus]|uniref:Nucleolar protein 16 n=1 Tax=Austrofundulus limnaeus TaxID=52670 RepID=A0A2I4AVK5_AUSLI|nr:PREDICTED: nucleolar protein 16 [Austrofundulus limnaeus]